MLWEREEIAPEQFLLLSTIFCCLLLDFLVKTGTIFSPRDKRLFEITEVEITRVDCTSCENVISCRNLKGRQNELENMKRKMFMSVPQRWAYYEL